jgi:Uma2 family endonuclease
MTVADYLSGPEETGPLEMSNFVVREPPAPMFGHQSVVTRATVVLDTYVRSRGLGRVCVSPVDVVLDRNQGIVVQPDVIFVSHARASIIGDWVEGAPDLVLEVASRGTAKRDRTLKLAWYLRYGVREYWILDPAHRLVVVFELAPGREPAGVTHADEERVRSLVLPDFNEPASAFFG